MSSGTERPCIVVDPKGGVAELCLRDSGDDHYPRGGALLYGDSATVFRNRRQARRAIERSRTWWEALFPGHTYEPRWSIKNANPAGPPMTNPTSRAAPAAPCPDCGGKGEIEGQITRNECVHDVPLVCPACMGAAPAAGEQAQTEQPDTDAIREKMFACKGGAVFVIIRDGAVLMERCPKKAAMFGGEWFLPGGKIEGDEDPDAACRREALEELGVRLGCTLKLPVIDGAPEGWPFFALHPFAVLSFDGEIPTQAVDSAVAFRWVPIAEALASPVPQVRAMVSAAIPTAPPAPPEREGEQEGACGACDGFGVVSHARGPNHPYPCEVCGGSGIAPEAPAQAEEVERMREAYLDHMDRKRFEALPADVEREDEAWLEEAVETLVGKAMSLEGIAGHEESDAEMKRMQVRAAALRKAAARLRATAELQRSSPISAELGESAPAGGEPVAFPLAWMCTACGTVYRWEQDDAGDLICVHAGAPPVHREEGTLLYAHPAPAPQPEAGA